MKIFILAAGDQGRFNLDYPKQLTNIFGESIIERTERLLVSNGIKIEQVCVVTRNKVIAAACLCRQVVPREYHTILHSLYSTKFEWDNTTIVLLGDVYYTNRIIRMLLTDTNDCIFYGNSGEIFALKFTGNYVLRYLQYLCSMSGELKLWHLYRYIENIPINEHTIILGGNRHFRFIDDLTNDIDSIEDITLLKKRIWDTYNEVKDIQSYAIN